MILTKVEGNDGVSRSWSQLSEVFWLLLQCGEETFFRLCTQAHATSGEEAAHVLWLEQGLGLLQGENFSIFLDVTAGLTRSQ